MNDFTARKLGEVLAFIEITMDTYQRAKEPILKVINEDEYNTFMSAADTMAERIKQVATDLQQIGQTQDKAAATNTKLGDMRDRYIGDEWDNPTEIYEWLSFTSGAGAAHAALVWGAGHANGNSSLTDVADKTRALFHGLLDGVENYLKSIGKERGRN